jgi:hypothetical protein
MKSFDQLKTEFGATPKEPLHLSHLQADCDQCARPTSTKILFMNQGLGNACALCGRLRRGKPYLSKPEFETLKPDAADGGTNDAEIL